MRIVWSVLLVAVLLAVGQDASAGLDPLARIHHDLAQKSAATSGLPATNGQFSVEVWRNGAWSAVDTLSFGQFYTHQRTRIAADGTHPVRIRIRQSGGGLAHIDALSLRGAASAVLPGLDRAELDKLLRSDHDVLDATRRELVADIVPTGNSVELDLHARVEPPQISTHRFVYPVHDRLGRDDSVHSTYRYRLGSRPGRLTPDGELQEVAQAEPFFSGFWPTGSGHPDGTTYGWVSDDGEFLYVAVDFTADNTLDGDKDYAAVIVRTAYGERTFRLSVNETDWGQVGFTYTPRVNYQHKVYEFKIPLAELGIEKPTLWQQLLAAAGLASPTRAPVVEFAVAAYGTASAFGFREPRIAYNSTDNEFLGVFEFAPTCCSNAIWGQRYDKVGTAIGAPFAIATSTNSSVDPDVAYDPVNNRYLVVFTRLGTPNTIMGRLVNADGSLVGNELLLSGGGQSRNEPAVAFSTTSQRYGVAFLEGSFPNALSAVIIDTAGGAVASGMLLSTTEALAGGPLGIAWNSADNRFVVAFQDTFIDSTDGDIVGISFDSNATPGPRFDIADRPGNGIQQKPAVAYDPLRNRFLAILSDTRGTFQADIVGQLFTTTGQTFLSATTQNVVLVDSPFADDNYGNALFSRGQLGLDYDAVRDEFVISFISARPTTYNVYYQRVSAATLAAVGATSAVNTMIATTTSPDGFEDAQVAVNQSCGGFVIIYHKTTAGSSSGSSYTPGSITTETSADIFQPCPGPALGMSVAGVGTTSVVDFGSLQAGTAVSRVVTLSNAGAATLVVSGISLISSVGSPFSITVNECNGASLLASQTCRLVVAFEPVSSGTFADTLNIQSNDRHSARQSLFLQGIATPRPPRIDVHAAFGSSVTDRTIFGSVEIGTAATSTVIVSNSGDQNLTIGSVAVNDGLAAPFSVSADTCSSNTLQAGERCTVTVSFAPAAT
ncbi:MAG: choice-of-anchor D domain-containing protein, partial [Candidatus Dadabacteria bacterium]